MGKQPRQSGVHMSEDEMSRVVGAEQTAFRSPLPTQVISNGEFNPPPQTERQRQVEALVRDYADKYGKRHGLGRRRFLKTASGMAAAFLASNQVFGPIWMVSEAEAADAGKADERAKRLSGQFIFDDQTHFVRDDFDKEGLLELGKYASQHWNPAMLAPSKGGVPLKLHRYKMQNYLKEVFLDSDTKVALLSGAPFDDPNWWLLSNAQIAAVRNSVNKVAGSRRMLGHFVFTPNYPGWMDEVDRGIAELKPDSWKGYTLGDPLSPTQKNTQWRLDDEKLLYPFYERIVKSGPRIVCIHKGLLPADYEKSWPNVWQYNTVWDLEKAAKDWPQINFVIYHSALRPFMEAPAAALAEFEQTGRIKWATDLAEIPAKFGVSNVYGEIGTAFATCAVADPRFAAAFLGTLVRGLGADHVIWGSDSVWYGSPQWQIEALRRLEIPADMQKQRGFAPLGPADGLVKSAIFAGNSARLYKVHVQAAQGA